MNNQALERIRFCEIKAVQTFIPPGSSVLEIGGSNGFQASQMAKSGCVVTSIDLAARQRSDRQYFPVIDYDGEQLPFSENSFDVVYSSNVLEHVERLEVTLAEIQRVLRKHGIAIHVLPTPTWRIWTSLTHYPFLCKLIARRIGLLVSKDGTRRSQSATRSKSVAQIAQQKGALYVVRRALYAGSHGVYPSAFSELYYFSEQRWRQVFIESGFEVTSVNPAGIFYTGYQTLPHLPMTYRRILARVLNSACKIYVMRRGPDDMQHRRRCEPPQRRSTRM